MDTATGGAVDETLDFRLTGPLELWWTRYYDSSLSGRRFAFGWGHTHEFDRTLRCDLDGFTYSTPIGRAVSFPPLLKDGQTAARDGYRLERVSPFVYRVFRHAEPAVEFVFGDLRRAARPVRLFRGKAEIRFQYGASGRWERIIDSVGRVVEVAEAADGRIESLTLAAGSAAAGTTLVAYRYDDHGNVIATVDSSGYGFSFEYDAQNRLLCRTGRKGFRFRFTYGPDGKCVKCTGDDRMHEVRLDYEPSGRITKVTRADGGVWTYVFDDAGGLDKIIDPLGGVQAFVRDKTGRVKLEIDSNGNATGVVYDEAGAMVAKVGPLGDRSAVPEDPNAPIPRRDRVAGNPAEYEYGRLLDVDRILVPDAREAAALPLAPNARRYVVTRTAARAPAPDHVSRVRPLGALWWPKPVQGRVFNDLGKLVRQVDPWGRTREWVYDASGNDVEYIDFDGSRWTYDRGNWHLVLGETSPDGASVALSYHPSGELARCDDAGGTRSEYLYDFNDHLVEVRRNGAVRDRYTRDAVGNLLAKHAADGRPLLKCEFGVGNVLVKRTLASGDEHTFAYDKTGHCTAAATTSDRLEMAYDRLGNRSVDKRNGCGIEYRYRGWRTPESATFLDRYVVLYKRTRDNCLIVTDPGGAEHEVRLYPHGCVERRFSNGASEISQYDNQGRCLFKYARRRGTAWVRRFEWSGEGELRGVQDSRNGVTRHEYDAGHRLRRRVLQSGEVEEYDLDAAGNLTRQPGLDRVSLMSGNRLQSAGSETFEYNDRNHVAARANGYGAIRYAYDSRDQLLRMEMPEGVWTAEYDAFGRRSRKCWRGRTTEYYWSGDQLIAEITPEGRVRLYVYSDPLALTPLLFLDYGSLEAPPESCRRYFIYSDQIGTPCLIEDESGTEVWRASVDPYGRARVAPGAAIDFHLRFPGHYFDAETGLHYNRFRYYDPALGRYLQSDPWGIAGGYNLYAYLSNPLLKADVRGLGEEETPKSNGPKEDEESTNPNAAGSGGDGEGSLPTASGGGGEEEAPPTGPKMPSDDELWRAVFDATTDRRVTEGAVDPRTGQIVTASSGPEAATVLNLPEENLVPGTGDPRGKCGMPRAVQSIADDNGGQLPPGDIPVTQGGFRKRPDGTYYYKAPCENCNDIFANNPQLKPSGLPPGVPSGLPPGGEVPFTPPPEWTQ